MNHFLLPKVIVDWMIDRETMQFDLHLNHLLETNDIWLGLIMIFFSPLCKKFDKSPAEENTIRNSLR